MEISVEKAEASDIPKKPRSLDLQSIYVKKSRSSDTKFWDRNEVLVSEQESRVSKKKLGSPFEEGGLPLESRKHSRKEVSLSSLEPASKRQRNSSNVPKPKQSFISCVQKDNCTSGSDATHNPDRSNGNAQCLGSDISSRLSKKIDHASSSDGTSKNKSYLGEDLVIPKRPRCISKWRKAKDPISLEITISNSGHEKSNTDAQDNKSSISDNLNSQVSDDKREKKAEEFELNGFHKDDSAPCTSVENDSHIKEDDRKAGNRKKYLKISEQSCIGNDESLADDSGDSIGECQDDEDNLEENAARMLSSRFDPSCSGFSVKRMTCTADPVKDSSIVQSDHGRLKVSKAEGCSVDATDRVLRPRRHNGKSFARKRRHFYEVCSRDMDPYCVVKQRIRVFWPLDQSWYFGLVKGYDPVTRLHHVKYDDRDEEWINLQKERFKLLLFPSEVSGKFNFGKPGPESRQKKTEEQEVMESSYIGSLLESEPIISWLTRTTRRVTSSPSTTIKKHLRVSPFKDIGPSMLESKQNMSMNPFDKDQNKLFSKCNESEQSRDQNINRVSGPKRSIDSEGGKLPFVYFRKRFRSKKEVLDTKVVQDASPGDPDGSLGTLGSVANSTIAKDELNTMWTWLEFKEATFELSLPPQCSLVLSVQNESLWLCRSLDILDHGKLVCVWPAVRMEMFFIDNVFGSRFLLFEGCLKHAVSLFCLIIKTVNGHAVKSNSTLPEISCSSIGLKISSLHNLGEKLLFVFNTLSNMKSSKWRYLEDKLKKHCTKEALATAEFKLSDIQKNQNLPKNQIVLSSVESLERFWGRSSLVCRRNLEKVVDPNTNSGIDYLAQEHEKPLLYSLFFASGPSFSLTLHFKLLIEKDAASFYSGDEILVSSQEHADNNDKLAVDGCSSFGDPSKQAPEALDNSGTSLNQAVESHGRPSMDTLSVGSNFDLNGSAKNFLTSEVNVIQNAVDDSGDVGKNTGDEDGVQFRRFPCEAGTSQFAEDSSSEYPERSSFPNKSLEGGCRSCINKTNAEDQLLHEIEKPSLHKGLLIAHPASNLVLEMNEHAIHSPTAPRSMWHRNRHTSVSRTFIHHPRLGSEDLVANGFTSGYKRPRTQVSYSQLSGGYEHAAKHRSNHQKLQPHKKVKALITNVSSNCSRSYMDSLSCDANVLVTHGDKCWREFGAKVQLDCDDQKNWRICVKVSGATKYVYKAYHVLQPGTTNRYTHAMMWKGGKEWVLEFTDRSQWYIFKQMHEECYNQNIRAASVKNIPIPGVRLLSDVDDGYVEVPFVRCSSKYFRQIGSEVDLALDPSHVLYDMDSEDEEWISKIRVTMDTKDSMMSEVAKDMFERVMDLFEKLAYTQQSEEFTNDDIEEYMRDVVPADLVEVIYEHWRQKRKKKGLPLIRQFQPPLWERYQQLLKEWESNMNKMPFQPEGCQDKAYSLKKPPMFAFCWRPRGLEIPNKGSKQRSHKKPMFTGHHNVLMREQDGFHIYGRKTDGISVGEVAICSYESSDSYHGLQSRSTFSPRDTASTESLFIYDGSERCPDPKFCRSTSKKMETYPSPRDPQGTQFSYNQRANRNGINRWSSEFCEWSSIRQSQSAGFQRHNADMDEFRLRDATSAAQHALNMAKLKREKAQWLLHKADLALHRATVALMTAEAIKTSEKDIVGDG